MTLQIKIKYSDDTQTRISKIEQGDWIDLRAAEDITIKKVNSNLSRLELRWNCRKDMRPMSFRVQVHISISVSFRQIQWESLMNHIKATMTFGFSCIRASGYRHFQGERICQFRIMKKMPEVELIEVDKLGNNDRGGLGSTGTK